MTVLTPNVYDVINPNGKSDWLLICEHAGNHIPKHLSNLGLSQKDLNRHIAYDIGAYQATLSLSKQLNATAVICNISRLVIDCNRPIHKAIISTSDGTAILGNANISPSDLTWRINQVFFAFHHQVFSILTQKLTQNPNIKIANIHSFTPQLNTEKNSRPWEMSFIYDTPYPSQTVVQYLKQKTNHIIGENQPYSATKPKVFTIPFHAKAQDLAYLLIEFRQDLINTSEGVEYWSSLLSQAITQSKI